MLPIKNYEPGEIYLIFEKGRNALKISSAVKEYNTNRFCISENQTARVPSFYWQKCKILAKRKTKDAFLLVLRLFFARVIASNQ